MILFRSSIFSVFFSLALFTVWQAAASSCPPGQEPLRGQIVRTETAEVEDRMYGVFEYTYRGGWNSDYQYKAGDTVFFNSNFWILQAGGGGGRPNIAGGGWKVVFPRVFLTETYSVSHRTEASGDEPDSSIRMDYQSTESSDFFRTTYYDERGENSICGGEYLYNIDGYLFDNPTNYTIRITYLPDCNSHLYNVTGNYLENVSEVRVGLAGVRMNINPSANTTRSSYETATTRGTTTSSRYTDIYGHSNGSEQEMSILSGVRYGDDRVQEVLAGEVSNWEEGNGVASLSWDDSPSFSATVLRYHVNFDCLGENADVELVYSEWPIGESEASASRRVTEVRNSRLLEIETVQQEGSLVKQAKIVVAPVVGYYRRLEEVRIKGSCEAGGGALNNSGASLGSVRWWLALGLADDGRSVGNLRINEDELGGARSIHSALYYDGGLDPEVTILRGDNHELRQVIAPQAFVDVVAIDQVSFEIYIYPRGNEHLIEADHATGTDDGDLVAKFFNGFYHTEDEPLAVWRIQVIGEETFVRMLEIAQIVGDVTRYVFTHDKISGEWTLVTGGGSWEEARLQEVMANGDRRSVWTIYGDEGAIIRKTVETERHYPFGWRQIEVVEDPDGDALTRRYSYYDADPSSASYGMMKSQSDSDGHWSRYEYDSNGREVKAVTGWLSADQSASEADSVIRSTSYSADGLTSTFVETTMGVETARSYFVRRADGLQVTLFECVEPGAAISASSNRRTVTTYVGSGEYKGRVAQVEYPDGTVTRYDYSTDSNGQRKTVTWRGLLTSAGGFSSGTRTDTVTGQFGYEQLSEVRDIVSGLVVDGYIVTSIDDKGRPLRIDYFDGTYEEKSYACCGVAMHRDRQGAVTLYTYNDLGYEDSVTRNGVMTITHRDPLGRVVRIERKGSDGSVHMLREGQYAVSGEILKETDSAGSETTYSKEFSPDGERIETTVFPDGGTRVERYHRDGKLRSVFGTAVRPVRYEYEILPGGLSTTKTIRLGIGNAESEWMRSVYDFSGRLIRTEYPDGAQTFAFYNAKGQRIREVDADGVTHLYWQSDDGSQAESAIDLNNNGMIDVGDRRSKQVSSYVSVAGVGVVSRTEQWVDSGEGYELDSVSETSVDGLWSRTVSHGLVHSSQTVYDGIGGWTTTSIAPDGSETVSTSANGFPVSTVSPVGSTTYAHDAHGRLVNQTDVATGIVTTTAYGAGDRVSRVTRAGEVTEYEDYDWRGIPLKIVHPGGTTSEYSYSLAGDQLSIGGTFEYPISYTYDPQGRRTSMTTSSGTTLWNYDSKRGWLNRKVHADSNKVSYTYTPAGRFASRQWARGVVTTYSYDAAGDLRSLGYSDSTVGYAYTRDVRGRIVAVEDGVGKREFVFGAQGALLSETMSSGALAGLATEYSYNALHRLSGLALQVGGNTIYNTAYGYDSVSRLASVFSQGMQTSYSRLARSNRLTYKSVSLNANPAMAVAYSYDGKGRLLSVASTPQAGGVHSMSYQYDAHGRRSQAQRADDSYWTYGYNTRGEVTSGKRYWDGGVPISGMDFSYSFDDIGNRLSATVNERQSTYVTNNVNQHVSRTVPAWFDLFGLVATPGTEVVVNENALLNIEQNLFHATVPAPNGSQPAFVPVTVVADDGNEVVSIEGNRFVPQSPEAFRYDADGNLLEDGRWLYTWDGENRLVAMHTRPEVIAAGVPGRRLTFGYDYMGRRVSKEVYAWHLNAWQPLHQRTFIYNGWNLIAERRADGSLIRTYAWGEDVSGSMQGAGGIGGLLAIHDHIESKTFIPAYDGNGNVIALVDAATGTTAATYEYDSFGNLLLQNGAYALINPFRFSTKYTDNESGLLYYGYRYYNPDTGRWISRDPIEEQGGVNVYAFAQNNGVGYGDLLGLDFIAIGTRAIDNTGWLPNGERFRQNGFNHMSIVYIETKCDPNEGRRFKSLDDIREMIPVDGSDSFELLADDRSYHIVLSDYSAIPGNLNPVESVGIPMPSSIGVTVSVINRGIFRAARHIAVVSDSNKRKGHTKEKWKVVSKMVASYQYALSSPSDQPERLDRSGHWPRVKYVPAASATNSNTFIRYLARGIGVNADVIGGGHFGANSPSMPANSSLPGYIGPVRRK